MGHLMLRGGVIGSPSLILLGLFLVSLCRNVETVKEGYIVTAFCV